MTFLPAQQPWVSKLPIMQQSVLFAAVRAPDNIRKNHPVKILMRWYRRCILFSAFDRSILEDPFIEGGGSFTGPFTSLHAELIWDRETGRDFTLSSLKERWSLFGVTREVYLEHVDELPHHFQLHFMHAVQIVGVHHPVLSIREWWWSFYRLIVNDAHLHEETPEEMNLRLSDNPETWRDREVIIAR